MIRHLASFTQIVQTICDLDRASAEHSYGALSPWWQNIREMLLANSSVFKSLLAALLCRDLSVLYRHKEVNRFLVFTDQLHIAVKNANQFSLTGSRQYG